MLFRGTWANLEKKKSLTSPFLRKRSSSDITLNQNLDCLHLNLLGNRMSSLEL